MELQMVGVTALWIASKYEDVYTGVPLAEDMVIISDGAYTKSEFLAAEISMLVAIGFRVGTPTARDFLDLYLPAGSTERHMADYIAERTLQEANAALEAACAPCRT